ncbi:DUF1131 family protein [Phenylobacterium sp.]|uniref:DUF1131 family protein n=1 Tax=Phenylobacterium sp. TaxID=1871053 RepID=UPI002730DB24|nr:DUF1131 family protein [Phenylobacterium sp.]MDP1617633.1 DUF1131 family protein [Phenylobacterium sp.]MDP1988861.1 DUF1131 family protein [Phenylobacterium sp.]
MRNLIFTALAGALLAACGPQASAPGETSAVPPPAPKPAVVGPILITFSERGAGEINGETAMDVRRLGGLFPESTVRRAPPRDGDTTPTITVRRADGLELDLRSAADAPTVSRILGRAGPVTGPQGEELGASWSQMGFLTETCARGAGDMAGALICYRQGAPRLGYVFGLPGFTGPANAVPDEDFLDENARLNAFMWSAQAG